MPFYDFQCIDCGTRDDILCTVSKCPKDDAGPECSKCGKNMTRDYNQKPKGFSRTGMGSYANGVVSQALAINPEQTEEHHKLFPDVEVLPDGCIKFDSYKQHDKYLKETGFQKLPQKLKGLGAVRIDK
ncbi:hypothetical protein LCGC14_1404060 [marine sediment metagenome]|uniref:Putative regulatory protein FmdB zinc ribbon domain-containing protein n=1 Tax=marine sediment metagenome TaxID=412755 RepID=A0A0F9JWG4_9ZZZZ